MLLSHHCSSIEGRQQRCYRSIVWFVHTRIFVADVTGKALNSGYISSSLHIEKLKRLNEACGSITRKVPYCGEGHAQGVGWRRYSTNSEDLASQAEDALYHAVGASQRRARTSGPTSPKFEHTNTQASPPGAQTFYKTEA